MKNKKVLLVIGIFCVVGVSYAIWQVTHVQTGENSLTVGCFKVEFTDLNPIQIGKAYPIEDSIGASLTPYEFTITNTCNDLVSYQINLEVLNDSIMNEYSYIKAMLDEENPKLLTGNPVVEKTLENANTAYKLKKSYLNANETKNFTLRLWLDKNTPANETIMNSVFKSKVTITTSYIDEAPLASGTLRSVSSNESNGLWQYKGQITKLIIEDELKPIEGAIASFDESSTQDKSVMSYVVENKKENETDETTYTAYLQSNEKLYLSTGISLFYKFKKLESIEGMRYIDTSKVKSMNSMFDGCSNLTSLDLSTFNTSNVTDMNFMFKECRNLTSLDLSTFNTSNVTNMWSMFKECGNLTSLDLSNFSTPNVTDMGSMFYECSSLTTLDISNFNTEKVRNMNFMFARCSSLTILNVSNFNTPNVTDMSDMFQGCSSLTTLDISNFNTSNVTNMRSMFYECSNLTALNVSNFNTSNVTNMAFMFFECSSLTTLDVSTFNTEQVTDMSYMFSNCSNLTTLDVNNFNTGQVIDMKCMFSGCSNVTNLDLSNFDTRNVEGSSNNEGFYMMFSGCRALSTIIYGDNFIYANAANVEYMFSGCFANKPTHESWSGITF